MRAVCAGSRGLSFELARKMLSVRAEETQGYGFIWQSVFFLGGVPAQRAVNGRSSGRKLDERELNRGKAQEGSDANVRLWEGGGADTVRVHVNKLVNPAECLIRMNVEAKAFILKGRWRTSRQFWSQKQFLYTK